MHKLKVTTVGGSAGVMLPKEVLARLKVSKGDTLCLAETAEGYVLSPYDPTFAEEMTAARRAMRRYCKALRELAK